MTETPLSPEASTALAKPLTLRPTFVSRLALGLVSAVPIGIAIAASAWIATAAFGVGVIGVGTALARRRISLDSTGATRTGLLGTTHIPWGNVSHYTYWSGNPRARFFDDGDSEDKAPGVERTIDGPFSGVTTTRHNLVIHARSGGRIAITTGFAGAGDAVAIALAEIHARHAERTEFAPFTIEEEGLRHPRAGFLEWFDVESARLNEFPPVVQIMKDGKAFPWASASLAKVHDGCLFLEKLAARGIPVDIGSRQLVPASLVETLRRTSLPRAEVVVRKKKPKRGELPQAKIVRRDR
ncbi:MAG TPA: hypothetical protein VGM39_02045 [Kofleriaceae bacterium]